MNDQPSSNVENKECATDSGMPFDRLCCASMLAISVGSALTVIGAGLKGDHVLLAMCCFSAAIPILAAWMILHETGMMPPENPAILSVGLEDLVLTAGVAFSMLGFSMVLLSYNVAVGMIFGASVLASATAFALIMVKWRRAKLRSTQKT